MSVDDSPACACASQSTHAVCPVRFWYVSAAHAVHVGCSAAALSCTNPALHRHRPRAASASECALHATHAVAPAAPANSPSAQSSHASFPLAPLNLPAAHCTHRPSTSSNPGSHRQSATTALPAAAVELPWHATQAADAVPLEYVSAAHVSHAALPLAALNVPAAHATHGPPSSPENPASHVHAVIVVRACSRCELCAGQRTHDALCWLLYESAGHFAQTPGAASNSASNSEYPGTHTHCSARHAPFATVTRRGNSAHVCSTPSKYQYGASPRLHAASSRRYPGTHTQSSMSVAAPALKSDSECAGHRVRSPAWQNSVVLHGTHSSATSSPWKASAGAASSAASSVASSIAPARAAYIIRRGCTPTAGRAHNTCRVC
jgi:hypothetical protein